MKVPQTSLDAYRQVHPDMKSSHYGKIMSAMRLLGIPSSMEAIAKKAEMALAQVSRRMGELEKDGCVIKDGEGFTSSGRRCSLYALKKQVTDNSATPNVYVQRQMF